MSAPLITFCARSDISSEIQILGLLCTVDLFPVSPNQNGLNQKDSKFEATPPQSSFSEEDKQHILTFVPAHPYPIPSGPMSTTAIPSSPPVIPGFLPASYPAPDIVHYSAGFPVTETSKMTQALVGATFIQPVIVEYQGNMSIMFVFSVRLVSFCTYIYPTINSYRRTWPLRSKGHSFLDIVFSISLQNHTTIIKSQFRQNATVDRFVFIQPRNFQD